MSRVRTMLVGTELRDEATGAGLVRGYRTLGWGVQVVERGEFLGSAKTWPLRAATRLSRGSLDKAYRERIRRVCEDLRPDVFFTVKGVGLNADLLRHTQSLGTRTVMYYPDVHFDHAGVDQGSFAHYDLFITTKSFQLPWLEQRLGAERVAYVPHGYSDTAFQPVLNDIREDQYRFDVLYMGNHSAHKQQWLERLLALNPRLTLGVVGNRWQDQGRPLPIPPEAMLGEVRGLALAQLIQTSRINVALHYGKTSTGWEDLVSTRTFEIPACKGFMLHIDNAEIRQLFKVGEEIDVFSSVEGLQKKIEHYLQRPELRRAMIDQAFFRCVPNYGYSHRAAEICQLIDRVTSGIGHAA